jgi:hypothetical protein
MLGEGEDVALLATAAAAAAAAAVVVRLTEFGRESELTSKL